MRFILRHTLFALATLSALLSAFFLWLFHELFWKYRHLFDERGRYFEKIESVVYDQDSAILGLFAAGCALMTLIILLLRKKTL